MSQIPERYRALIQYIETHLDHALDANHLCQQMQLSKFHFHRQCSASFGVPVMTLVRLLQLKRAAYWLAFRHEIKVIDIALASGYASHEAFSRAFKEHFQFSPSEFRTTPDWRYWQTHYEPIEQLRNQLMHAHEHFAVQVLTFPATQIALLQHRGPPSQLSQSILRFIEWRKLRRLPPDKSRTFNLIYDDPEQTAPQNYRFGLACSVSNTVDDQEYGITTKTIPGGLCATIRHTGSDDKLAAAVRYLYGQWLSTTDYTLRDFPLFFERVRFFPDVPEHAAVTDIYLPIANANLAPE